MCSAALLRVGPALNIKSVLKEPVLHFLLIGVAIFVAYGLVAPRGKEGARIVVTQGVVDALVREHQARWQRPPTEQELAGLVDAYVRDEILYREGIAMGLDRDDPVIKRRVRQKLDVIAEEQQARDAPTDADLAAYLAQHADRFTRPGTVSFEQIYFPANATAAEVEAARASAARGADPARLGQSSMLPPRAENVPLDLAARDFGSEFVSGIAKLPLNEWAGPVRSGFGLHLVRVTARTPSVVPPLAEVSAAVAREWENERRVASLSESYKKLRSQYEIVIEAKQVPPIATR
jgi:parvulin-like peptidyl-prolyl isomerase